MEIATFNKMIIRFLCPIIVCVPFLVSADSLELGDTQKQPAQIKTEITQPVKIGIHLASYEQSKNIRSGWERLAHDFAEQLAGRVPLYYQVRVKDRVYTRLVVGSFRSQSAAMQVCKSLKTKGQYCQVTSYKLGTKKHDV